MFTTILLGVLMFTGVVAVLVGLIVAARKLLVPEGDVSILINEQKEITVPAGGKLLNALASNGIFVSSACGGGGTCAQCKVHIQEGGGDILDTEKTHINKKEERAGCRLSCQVGVKQDMKIEVPPEVFETKNGGARFGPIATWPRSLRNWFWNCRRAKMLVSRRAATFRSNVHRTA